MRLPGEEDVGGGGPSMVYMIIGAAAFICVLVFALFQANRSKDSGSDYLKQLGEQKEQEAAAETAADDAAQETGSKLRAQDLDFWDMYPEEDAEAQDGQEDDAKSTLDEKAERERQEQKEKEEQAAREDPSTDGKHTLVTLPDGTEEWVLISPYLSKNTYDYTNLEDKAGLKRYLENDKEISYVGVDISQQTGSVNFESLKAAGIDYVMIRLGARGYSTGQITVDEKFHENIEGAAAAGLDVGVYFYSQAVSADEAVQEASVVIQNLEPYKASVRYPVAFDMSLVGSDQARSDGLSRDDRTTVAAAFLETVSAAGYTPMVYGDKEWLIKEVDLTRLQQYDIWLAQEQDIPDYPYRFAMWQYTTSGTVNGIRGDANLNLSFIGYSQR